MTETYYTDTESWTDADYIRELNALKHEYNAWDVFSHIKVDSTDGAKMFYRAQEKAEEFKEKTKRFRKRYAKTSVLFMKEHSFGRLGPYCTYEGIYESLTTGEEANKGYISIQLTTDYNEPPFIYERVNLTDRNNLEMLNYPISFLRGPDENLLPDRIERTLERLVKVEKHYEHTLYRAFLLNHCLHIIQKAKQEEEVK